jgi:hypothetical protein
MRGRRMARRSCRDEGRRVSLGRQTHARGSFSASINQSCSLGLRLYKHGWPARLQATKACTSPSVAETRCLRLEKRFGAEMARCPRLYAVAFPARSLDTKDVRRAPRLCWCRREGPRSSRAAASIGRHALQRLLLGPGE